MTEGHGDDIYRYDDIRINFSSNVYTHADLSKLEEHLREMVGMIRNYPEPEPFSLEAVIARKYDIPTECVLVTSGATEAIYLIAQSFSLQKESYTASILHPTFSEYEDACRIYGIPTLPDNDANTHSILWLCNPNNPTGSVVSPEKIQQYARQFDYVVVDQSYEDYTQAPMLTPQDAASSRNILQLHSLTKTYAIPGLRIGYIIAPPQLIRQLRQYVRPWAVNVLAIEAGKWLIENNVHVLPDLNTRYRASKPMKHKPVSYWRK